MNICGMINCESMTFARYADHDVEGFEAETDKQTLQLSAATAASSWQLPSLQLPLRVNLASVKAVASTLATIGFSHKSTFIKQETHEKKKQKTYKKTTTKN